MYKILLATAIPGFHFNQTNSAVVNYLNALLSILKETGNDITTFPAIDASTPAIPSHSKTLNVKLNPVVAGIKSMLKKVNRKLYNSVVGLLYLRKINGLLRHIEELPSADVVIEFLNFGSCIGFHLKAKRKTRCVVIYDAPLCEQYVEMYGSSPLMEWVIKYREKKSIRSADAIICYSKPVAEYLSRNYSIDLKNCFVLPTISFNKLTAKESGAVKKDGSVCIGFIGSFLKFHRVDLLVDVFDRLSLLFPHIFLYLVGYGEEWDSVLRKVERSPNKSRIFMPGYLPESELEKIKQKFDIGVIPYSNWYGSPLKLFEYAALGIPIVAPGTPTISELFTSNREILLFSPAEPEKELFEHLKRLIQNENERSELGANALTALYDRYSKLIYKEKLCAIISYVTNLK